MNRHLKRASIAVLVLGALFVISIAWFGLQPGPMAFAAGSPVELRQYRGPSPTGVPSALAGADVVTRGHYLTDAADCQACHTKPGGTPYAGGRAFKLPFGTLYSPNITPDRETGIGKWSGAEFIRAVHKGVAPDGTRLYPAFPYASYALLTDQDVLAIKAYLFSLKAVRSLPPANTLAFPFNQRSLMFFWGAMFNRGGEFRPNPQQSPEWNRGAYLVEAAAHCAECHTPRNLFQAMNQRRKFAGGDAEGWHAYNITQDRVSGIGEWSKADMAAYLASGHAPGRGTASGPMREAVDLSLSKLAPSDIAAMATYLASVPAIRSGTLPAMAGPASPQPDGQTTGDGTGKRLFEETCASCHAWSGEGAILDQARLTGNRSVNDESAVNVAKVILGGAGKPMGNRPYMPAFGNSYTDKEVAAVANYVTSRFGSRGSKLTAADVAKLREEERPATKGR